MKRTTVLLLSLCLALLLPASAGAWDYRTAASGDWNAAIWENNSTGSWVNDLSYPDDGGTGAGATVTIRNTHSVYLNNNHTISSFTIDAGGALTTDFYFLSVGGNVGISGSFDPDCQITMTGTGTLSSTGSLGPVVIASSGTVTAGSSLTLIENVNDNGNLSVSAGTFASGGNTITLRGNWSVATTAVFDSAAGGTVVFAGGNAQTLDSGGTDTSHDFRNILVSKSVGTLTLQRAMDLNGYLEINSGTLASANYEIRVAGNWVRTGGTFNEGTGTVRFTGNGDTDPDTFYNMRITAGTRTTSGLVTVTNALTLDGGTFSPGAALAVNGSVAMNNGTWNLGSYTHDIRGAWNSSGATFTLNPGTSTVSLNTTAAPAITSRAGNNFNNLTVNNGGSLGSAIALNGSLTLTGGTLTANNNNISVGGSWIVGAGGFTPGSNTVTFTGSGTVDAETFNNFTVNASGTITLAGILDVNGNLTIGPSGVLDVSGSFYTIRVAGSWIRTGGTFNELSGLVIFDGTGTVAGDTFYDVQVATGGTVTLAGTLDCRRHLTISAGTLSAVGNQINVAGNYANAGTFTPVGNIVVFNGTVAQSADPGGSAFANITKQGGTRLTVLNNTLNVTGTLNVGAAADIVDLNGLAFSVNTLTGPGTFELNGTQAQTVNSYTGTGTVLYNGGAGGTVGILSSYDLTIAGAGTFNAGGALSVGRNLTVSSGTLSPGANPITVGGNWNATGGAFSAGTGTVTFTGTSGGGPFTLTPAGSSFYDLVLNLGGKSLSLSGPLTVNRDLTLTAGTLNDAAGNAIAIGRNWNVGAGLFTPGTSTVTFTGSGTVDAETFYNLTVAGTGSLTLAGAQILSRDLTINAGGSLDAAGFQITVGQSWTNGGTFTHGSGTVVFADNTLTASITGSTTFFDLTCTHTGAGKTLQFEPGTTQTVAGTLTLTGQANGLISLVDNPLPGGRWTIDVAAPQTVDFVLVDNSDVLSSDITANNSRDEGTNDTTSPGWIFPPKTLTWQGDVDFSWDVGANWDLGFAPNTGDTANIPNVGPANLPATLGSDVRVANLTIASGASVDQAGWNLQVDTSYASDGTLYRLGGEAGPQDNDSGLVVYRGALGGAIETYGVSPDYYDLEIAGTATFTLSAGLETARNLTISSGTLSAGANPITVGGNWTNSGGAFSAGTSTVTFTGASGGGPFSVTSAGSSFYDFTLNAAGKTLNLADPLSAGRHLTIVAGTLSAGVNPITVGGNWTNSGGAFSAGTGTVTFDGTSGGGPFTVTSNAQSFYQVVLNAAGKSYQQGDAATIGVDLTLTAGGWETADRALTVTGAVTAGAGTGTLAAAAAGAQDAISVGGDFTPAGFTAANSVVTLTGATACSVGVLGGVSFFDLTIAKNVGVTVTATSDWTVTNSLTMTSGTWLSGANTHTIAGDWDSSNASFTFTADSGVNTSTILLSPTLNPDITTKGIGTDPFYNLTMNNGGTLLSTLETVGNLTIVAGTLSAGANNINVGGNWDATGGAFSAGSSTVTFTGASGGGPFSVTSAGSSFYDFTLNALGKTLSLGDPLSVGRHLTIVAGTLSAVANPISVGGNWTNSGGVFSAGTGTVTFTGASGGGPFSVTSAGSSFYDFTLNALGKTLSLGDPLSVGRHLTITAGTLSAVANPISVGGNWTNSGGVFSAGTGTVTFTGASGGGPFSVTSGGSSFYDFTLNALGKTLSLGDPLSVGRHLTIVAGTLSAGVNPITVGGNWTNSGGAFSAGTSTVTFTGASGGGPFSVTSAGSSFYDFTLNAAGKTLNLSDALPVGRHLTIVAGTLSAGVNPITVGGNWTNGDTFSAGTGTVTFTGTSGAGPFTVTSNAQSFNQVVLNAAGKSYQQTDPAAVGIDLTLTAGSWETADQALTVTGTVTGAGTLAAAAAGAQDAISVGGDFTPVGFTAANSVVTLTGATACSVGVPGGVSFYDLVINKSAPGVTVTSTGPWTVTNSLTMTSGTWLSGANTHTIAGDWDSSNASFTFTADSGVNTSTILLSPTLNPDITTKGIGTDPFYNLTVNNGGTLGSTVRVLNILDIAAGDLALSGFNLTVSGDLTSLPLGIGTGTLTAAAAEAINVGADFTPAGFNAASSAVTLNTAAAADVNSQSFYNLIIAKTTPGNLVNSTGNWTVTNSLTMTMGTWDAGAFTHTIAGNWDSVPPTPTDFTFTANTSTILLSPTLNPGITTKGHAVDPFFNLTVSNGATLQTDLDVDGTLTIAGGTLDISAALYTIYAAGWTNNVGQAGFNERTGRVVLEGTGLFSTPVDTERFYELEKNTGTTTLSGDLMVRALLQITAGVINDSGAGNTITLGNAANPLVGTVIWDNQVGAGGYSSAAGEVVIAVNASDNVRIQGATTYNDLTCTTPGTTIRFQASGGVAGAQEQTVTGTFTFIGASGSPIVLDSTAASAGPYVNPPIANEQWELTISGTANIDWVDVRLSYANIVVTPGPNCTDSGDNYNWEFNIPVIISWAEDSDNNGRLDRIRAKVAFGAQLSDNYANISISVDGYTIDTAMGTNGFDTGLAGNDDEFHVYLVEKPYPDTGVVPSWRILANPAPGLFGTVGGAYVESGVQYFEGKPGDGVVWDGAGPVITYAVTAAGGTRAYLCFSEPVYGDSGAATAIDDTDFAYAGAANPSAGGLTRLVSSGLGTSEIFLDLDAPVTGAEIVSFTDLTATVWDKPVSPPLPDPQVPPNPIAVAAHNISDVGINIITPVWATTPEPQRDTVRGGIGLIRKFDGTETEWLRDLDITLQARILEGSISGDVITLHFSDAPSYPVRVKQMWVPAPPEVLGSDDLLHNPDPLADDINDNNSSVAAAQTVSGPSLRDFTIPAAAAPVTDGADLELLFLTSAGLPCGRLEDPADPRTARPYMFRIRDLREQRGTATIMNNVINPTQGETTKLYYRTSSAGPVTITVFDLKGDIVNLLYRGSRPAGEYSTTWDGRNRGGRIVARGIYFIKVVGPGINEIRKVLVVK